MTDAADKDLELLEDAAIVLDALLAAHCKEPDESRRGCHCFHAVEHAESRRVRARLKRRLGDRYPR